MDKEVAEKMVHVSRSLATMLEMAFQAFRKLTEESIKAVEETKRDVQQHSTELTKLLISKSSSDEKGREWVKPYLSMVSSFDRAAYNIDGIVDRLKVMIREETLFSDRAIKEVNDIFQEAMDLAENLPGLIVSQDKLTAQNIGEKVRSTFKIANGFSEEHEDRLIQGICLPKSSPIYLGILESLKGILTHTLEVSGKVVSLSSKSEGKGTIDVTQT
jgi:Na+/phosphate symporter